MDRGQAQLQSYWRRYQFARNVGGLCIPYADENAGRHLCSLLRRLWFSIRTALRARTRQTRAAFVYGAGPDINLTSHLFVRGEYRGFVYNSPTYDLTSLSGLDRVTHRPDPGSDSGGDSEG
jgi:opacity protein-like surface antigen